MQEKWSDFFLVMDARHSILAECGIISIIIQCGTWRWTVGFAADFVLRVGRMR